MADDAALQTCLNAGGTIKLVPGSPGYIIATGLIITQNNTVITSAAAPGRATLKAAAGLAAPILSNCPLPTNCSTTPTVGACPAKSNIQITYLDLDGSRPARNKTYCNPDFRPCGISARLVNVTGGKLNHSRLQRALCGTAFGFGGQNFEVAHNLIDNNGAGLEVSPMDSLHPWADGITLGVCSGSNIHDNVVIDATDVGIVHGGKGSHSTGCQIQNNDILQVSRFAFAGIHMADFSSEGQGNHVGSTISGNIVRGSALMSFGIAVGHHPWNPAGDAGAQDWTAGGTVSNNTLSGAFVNLVVDGACGVTVSGNTPTAPAGIAKCGPTSPANYVVNTAHVDTQPQCGSTGSSTYTPGYAVRSYDGCTP